MTVKYTCPKCSRRFAEWGAKKMEFKCPHDENCPPGTEDEIISLLRVGAPPEDAAAPTKPTLKRKKQTAAAIVQESDLITDGTDLEVVDEVDDEDVDDEADDSDDTEAKITTVVESDDTGDVEVDDEVGDDDDDEVEDLEFEDSGEGDMGDFADIEES